MSNYYRVKKYRELNRIRREAREKESIRRKEDAQMNININEASNIVNVIVNEASSIVNVTEEIDDDELKSVSESALFEDIITCKEELNDKILQWALNNLDTLRLNVITELLAILREEGYTSLPKTAQALLGTKHHRILQVMISNKETEAAYMYLGIRKGLETIISPDVYREKNISVLIHIDGMQIYNNSPIQVWPISVKLFHTNYVSKPFVAGIYCGDSKPRSSNDFLHDFVTEAKTLIRNGVDLNGKKYLFKICAIIADAPARAFIKYCKPPNSFYACERCTTRGISVGQKRVGQKRVYPQMDCSKRNKESFQNREQPEYHKDDVCSILLDLPDFNIINSVVIDSMHLLYLGVMKSLLEKWTMKKSIARLKRYKVHCLKGIMNYISKDIPLEFQRKKFDLNILPRWKATQYRFFLLYCSSTVLHDILPDIYYRHFLLLFVACRILNKQNVTS